MATKHRPLLYLETSVFGFCFDQEPRNALRREAATALFDQVRLGILDAVTSPVTYAELNRTAEPLRSRLVGLFDEVRPIQADDAEAGRLTEVYLSERVIPAEYVNDARHVAFATVGKADVLVSLNLRHLANEWAERRIGAVNLREGYQVIRIRTPEEVLSYED
jgi:hypothetical protein